jgi:hypothetical protein
MSRRADLLAAVHDVVRANIADGFVEVEHYKGMTTWAVPADLSPRESGDRPLPLCALGERQSYVSLFLMGLWYDPPMRAWLDAAWKAAAGVPLRRGKVSLQLRDLDETPLDVIAQAVGRHSVDDIIGLYERTMAGA